VAHPGHLRLIFRSKRKNDRVDARKTQAYVMFGLGGAGLAAAGIIALIDVASAGPEAAGRDDNAPRLEFTPLPGGGMLGFGWRY